MNWGQIAPDLRPEPLSHQLICMCITTYCAMFVVVLIALFAARPAGQDQAQYTDLEGGSLTPTGQRSGYFRFSNAQNL